MPHAPALDHLWNRETVWKLTSAGRAVAAAVGVRKALEWGWERTTGEQPPENPASPFTDWGDAVIWATVIGATAGVARILAHRGAAHGWKRVTGRLPTPVLVGRDR